MSDQNQLAIVNYRKDSYIMVEGQQKSECFFIIQQGKVRISRSVTVEGDEEETLVPGDFFGVASSMSSMSQIETAFALTDVAAIAVRPSQYAPLIQKNSKVATKILMQLSSRLRFLDDVLMSMSIKKGGKPVEDGPSRLFDVGEYYFRQKQRSQAVYAYAKYLKYCPGGKDSAAAAARLRELAGGAGAAPPERGKGDLSRTYKKDEVLFAEGELGDEFFVIQTGSVKISKIIDSKEVLLATLKPGDIFGEMALLEGKPRAASALAGEDCAVMAVSKANFEPMIQAQPQLIARITTLLSSRIWFTFKQLEVTLIANPVGKMYNALLIQLEKERVSFDSAEPHLFSASWSDLVKMLGLSEKEGFMLMGDLHRDKNIQVREDRVQVGSAQKVVKQADIFREIDARKKAK